MNRLTNYSHGAARVDSSHTISLAMGEYIGEPIERLAAYEDSGLTPEEFQQLSKAKAEGRLVMLPCKIGGLVFIIGSKYRHGRDETWINTGKFRWSDMEKLGKTVFLSREEAEKALREASDSRTVFLEPQEVSKNDL